MNIWKLTAAKNLSKEECGETPEEGKIRIRVTKVLISDTDKELYAGNIKTTYPRIPGCFAIGMVAEESGNPLFEPGRRVVLHTFLPAPDPGTEKADFSRPPYDTCGMTCDGFLRDVIYLSPEEMTPIPDSVNDEQALLLHHVALAKASVDRLNARKGQHVAVVGATLFGIFVCQLLIYQQAAPILIDKDQSRLDFARGCGIYYTALTDENLLNNVASLTGGRLASGAVFAFNAPNDPVTPFQVCTRKATVVMSGLAPSKVKIDLDPVLHKQITVQAINNCSDYLETAINLNAQKAVSCECFQADVYKAANANAAYEEESKSLSSYRYINLI